MEKFIELANAIVAQAINDYAEILGKIDCLKESIHDSYLTIRSLEKCKDYSVMILGNTREARLYENKIFAMKAVVRKAEIGLMELEANKNFLEQFFKENSLVQLAELDEFNTIFIMAFR